MGQQPVMVYVKVHETSSGRVVAICDEDLYGKTLYDPERNLYFHVGEPFYGGEPVAIEQAIVEAMQAPILNIVGEKIVSEAIRRGVIHPEAVIRIAGVPHAQAVRL